MGESSGARQRRVVAAFDEEAETETGGIAEVAERAGADPGQVSVGEPGDEAASLNAEMREEVDNTIAGAGNVGPFTKEMTKGLSVGTALGAPLGALLALPLAFLPVLGDVHVATRIVIVVAVGAFAGSTLGFVLGGGLAQRMEEKGKRLGAERGPVVGVDVDGRDPAPAAEALKDAGAVRVDEVGPEGEPRRRIT